MAFDQAIDLTGQMFGELRVIERAGITGRGMRLGFASAVVARG